MSDVGTWLAEIGLGQYADAFEANDVVHSARSDRRRSISNASNHASTKGLFVIVTGQVGWANKRLTGHGGVRL
jgi:SAM domain (Sterile alpha motif)